MTVSFAQSLLSGTGPHAITVYGTLRRTLQHSMTVIYYARSPAKWRGQVRCASGKVDRGHLRMAVKGENERVGEAQNESLDNRCGRRYQTEVSNWG